MTVEPRTLLRISLTRLPELQVASGLFRETAWIEGLEHGGESSTSLLSAAVVLLGLTRADEAELDQPFSTGALRTRILGDLGRAGTTAGELGLALWAESRTDGNAIDEIKGHIRRQVRGSLNKVPVEQLAWLVSGLTESQVLAGGGDSRLLDEAAGELEARIVPDTGLARDLPNRLRGSAVAVGGQLHVLHAFCQLKRAGRHDLVGDRARRAAASLLSLQRSDGGWPGLVDPARAEPAAWYPALTVTHVALAPLALRAASEIGLEGEFEQAIAGGLAWAGGGNPLGFNLVHEIEVRIDRGILPRRDPGAIERGLTLAGRRMRGRLVEPEPESLILDPAVSSDDLGWVLEAWAGR
ncbi:MAG: hypothetical protein M3Y45_05600 [Actinomycetota bacterium]|nr:hypothetical protein [Actinomycetota bacterium]